MVQSQLHKYFGYHFRNHETIPALRVDRFPLKTETLPNFLYSYKSGIMGSEYLFHNANIT